MVQDQDKSNCDLAYMTLFWRENQLVGMKKKRAYRRIHGLEIQSVSQGPRLI
jgi:hypothetical protein